MGFSEILSAYLQLTGKMQFKRRLVIWLMIGGIAGAGRSRPTGEG